MSTYDFVPGQCWISDTEADLGIGLVKACDQRRVTILFPAVGEERTYACANAPLSRVQYGVDDSITTVDGRRLRVREVIEHEGRLQYETVDEVGQPAHIVEAELDSFVQFNRPQDRLLAGQIDKNSDFELRVDTLRQRHRHQGAESFGLLGPRVQLLPHQFYIASEVARLELLIQKLEEKGREHQDLITEVQASVAALPDSPATGTVAGDRARQVNFVWSRKKDEPYHSVASAHPMLGPEWHETRCGWTFGLTLGLKRSADPPEGARPCETCYPELRKARDQRKVPLPGGVAPSAGGTRN